VWCPLSSDVNISFNLFNDELFNIYDTNFPLSLPKKSKGMNKPWMSISLLTQIKHKNYLYRQWKRKKTTGSYKNFTLYEKLVNSNIFESKKNYFQSLLTTSKNSKTNWKNINRFLGKVKCRQDIHLTNDLNEPIEDNDVPNLFRKFLLTNQSQATLNSNTEPLIPQSFCDPTFFLAPTNYKEVFICLNSLRNDCANQDTCIPVRLIKLIAEDICFPLSEIINQSFQSGVFPALLKKGKIIPVHKKNKRDKVNNYRPVCVLPIFSKIFEKLFLSRLNLFISRFKLLPSCQYGFVKGGSCQDAILHSLLFVCKSLNNNSLASLVLLDLSKAFDNVNHNILINKLQKCGIRGTPLEWIKSYLCQRPFFVYANNKSSDIDFFVKGVPQGGILSPTFFNLYLYDFPAFMNCESVQYADDTNLLLEGENIEVLVHKIKQNFTACKEYFNRNGLHLNKSKTEIIFFGVKKHAKITVNLDEVIISSASEVKFLGTYIDSELKMKKQISYLGKKLCSLLPCIYSIRNFLPIYSQKMFYYAFIYSHLLYPSLFLLLANSTSLNELQSHYKRVCKCLFQKNKRFSWSLLQTDYKLLNVQDIINLQTAKTGHQVFHQKSPPTIQAYFKQSNRESLNFLLMSHHKKSLSNQIALVWNSLPVQMKSQKNGKKVCQTLQVLS